MSSKESYIKMRNKQSYQIEWFYKYWQEQKGKNIDINTFHSIFNMQNLESILQFLDNKFELQTVWSAEGKFIKCF
jgi:hypothetical protein